jgi:hypothetical protein
MRYNIERVRYFIDVRTGKDCEEHRINRVVDLGIDTVIEKCIRPYCGLTREKMSVASDKKIIPTGNGARIILLLEVERGGVVPYMVEFYIKKLEE